jgi:magnesium transporter
MIRGMATGQVGSGNIKTLLNREVMIGFINSLLWAAVLAGFCTVWFKNWDISLAMAMALMINLVAGALAGVLVPVLLRRMSIDPAIAGGVILTTVTDIVGYVSFLGIATWLLIS